ncbi:hypothetical protein C2E25_09440 [Geothermobacter hydrogeniphilus]|uniref:Sensory/regulatory protein RpfC n=2 Tax=Geothermobacter hydrogeniphilus TaxID=1969733 RepID=A0A2K2H9M0_9BACT|nr:hypothetical protein C2E25_09440 [Geothermobacter hydrogeniphilus]
MTRQFSGNTPSMKQSGQEEDPVYNSRILDTYVKFLKSKYPSIDLNTLLEHTGISADEIADEGHWFSQRQVDRFYDNLVQMTGQNDIAREAGRFAASPESLGSLRQYLLGFMSLDKFFAIFEQTSKKLTRSATYRTRKLARNSYEVTVQPYPGMEEKPFQCANRTGFFEAIGTLFGFEPPDIEHSECLFKGGRVCRYVISWKKGRTATHRRFGLAAGVLYCSGLLLAAIFPPLRTTEFFWTGYIFFGLTLLVFFQYLEKQCLKKRLTELRENSQKNLEQINTNYNNALIINEIGQTISRATDIETILSDIVQIFQTRLDYQRCAIYLTNKDRTRLVFRQGLSQIPDQLDLARKIDFHLDNPSSRGIFITAFHQQRPILTNDINELKDLFSPRSFKLAQDLGVKSIICCPIICDGQSLGILAVDNFQSKRVLVKSDLSLLMGIASTLGVSIRNAELLTTLQNQLDKIKARDEELRRHSEILEEQVQKRTRELNEALIKARDLANQANAANREKSRFLANMSHEIRTPLYGVLGMTEILLKSNLNEDQRAKGLTVFESGKMLLRIIDDILDLSKIEAGKIEFENIPFTLRETVAATIELFSSLAVKKGLALTLDIDDRAPNLLRGDPIRLRQILSNLISNAIKFTERGGVEVRVEVLEDLPDRATLKFSVKDSGVGIPAEKLERIFEGFTQAEDSVARKYGGTGLGTTIARHLVELQGGAIDVESNVEQGTCFWFRLGYVKATAAVSAVAEAESVYDTERVEKPVHILLVEDNPVNREITSWHLTDALDCRVDFADNGIQAVAKTLLGSYDLILMDIQMPEMDGMTATALIRRNGYTSESVPIIGLTANILREDHQKCLAAGMNDVLHKPLTRETLLAFVRKWTADKGHGEKPLTETKKVTVDNRSEKQKRLDLFRGNQEMLNRVTDIFLRDTEEKVVSIKRASEAGDCKAIAGFAHAIRGSAGNLSCQSLAEIARRLEERSRAGDFDSIPGIRNDLELELARFRAEVIKEIKPAAADQAGPAATAAEREDNPE